MAMRGDFVALRDVGWVPLVAEGLSIDGDLDSLSAARERWPLSDGGPFWYPMADRVVAQTGVAVVDEALRVMSEGDRQRLAELLYFDATLPCVVESDGLDDPPICPAGVESGTEVDVMSIVTGLERLFMTREEADAAIGEGGSLNPQRPWHVFAIMQHLNLSDSYTVVLTDRSCVPESGCSDTLFMSVDVHGVDFGIYLGTGVSDPARSMFEWGYGVFTPVAWIVPPPVPEGLLLPVE